VIGSHAVVIGAGVSGLLAARVLADFYERVTITERDRVPAGGGDRAGVPQGRHVHALLARGVEAIRELFPGLVEELVAGGVPAGDVLADGRVYFERCRLTRARSGLPGIGVTRPGLEHHLRRRVGELPNVTFEESTAAAGFAVTPDGRAVTGLRVVRDGVPGARPADLVVDASGRGSRTPQWLAELGYPAPREDRIRIDVAYVTCWYSVPRDVVGGDNGIVVGGLPANPRGGAMIRTEGGLWLVSLAGYRGAHPPVTPEGFLAFAAALPVSDIHRALTASTPVDRPVRYRFPAAVRRRYELLRRFPDRLVVLGDAVCSFNPIYGQGMSIAAQQALILQRALRAVRRPGTGLPDLRRDIARAGAVAWFMSVSSDLRMPWIEGRRTPIVRLGNAYTARLYRAARHDAVVARGFVRVANLVDPPTRILRPGMVLRVLAGNACHRPADPAGSRASTETSGPG
jgi:2-polyprenyl-6-methoxyphenol hydroxylase-like FAD-dependent oxidoreductase